MRKKEYGKDGQDGRNQ